MDLIRIYKDTMVLKEESEKRGKCITKAAGLHRMEAKRAERLAMGIKELLKESLHL
jgi:hypothetical protein